MLENDVTSRVSAILRPSPWSIVDCSHQRDGNFCPWIGLKHTHYIPWGILNPWRYGELYTHLVGGLVVSNIFIVHFIYGMASFPLTNSIIFQDGYWFIAPPTRYLLTRYLLTIINHRITININHYKQYITNNNGGMTHYIPMISHGGMSNHGIGIPNRNQTWQWTISHL